MGNVWSLLFGGEPPGRTLMLGLDNAGKSTILYKLKLDDETVVTPPTVGFNCEVIDHGARQLEVWDVAGQSRIRSLWRQYFEDAVGIVFVVDSSGAYRCLPLRLSCDLVTAP